MKKICYLIPLIFIIVLLSSCDAMLPTPCEHEYQIKKEIEATCVSQGKIVEECIKCKEQKETKTNLKDHEFETFEVPATCEKEGKTYEVCKNCKTEKIVSALSKLPHDIEEVVYPATCEEDGYTNRKCKNCSFEENVNIIDALKHDYSDWTIIANPTETHDGLRSRKCTRCNDVEEEIIISSSYIDLSVIRYDFNPANSYKAESYEELLLLFQCAIFNHVDAFTCEVGFEFESLETLAKSLFDDEAIIINFSANIKYSAKFITFNFTYQKEPNLSTSKIHYEQFASLNYIPISKQRSDSFEEFLINESIYSYNVETSDQLFYVLERGVKPICKVGSNAEKLYQELKKILRNIISDDMTDVEKVKAIHDYLIMNIVYDHELLLKVQNNDPTVHDYNGFYLEGTLLDKKAVCEGISKTFTALCNIEGIPCVTVDGYQTNNPNGVGHAWNKVFVDNAWYIVDCTSDGTIINSSFEVLSYKYFLIDENTFKVRYTAINFDNIKCNKSINIYKTMNFKYNDETYDFNIESQKELDIIIAYYEKANIKKSTIEFKIDFDFGESCLDEITKAYQNNSLTANISYINIADNFMLIKG